MERPVQRTRRRLTAGVARARVVVALLTPAAFINYVTAAVSRSQHR